MDGGYGEVMIASARHRLHSRMNSGPRSDPRLHLRAAATCPGGGFVWWLSGTYEGTEGLRGE